MSGIPTQVEFLYDFASPNCYLAYHKLTELASKRKLEVRMTPLFLGGLFKITNDAPVPRDTNEYNYMVSNLERMAQTVGAELNFPHSTFPINSVKALRGSYFAESKGKTHEYVSSVFSEYWAKGTDISSPDSLGRVAESSGLDSKDFLGFIEMEETKQKLRNETQGAYERGVFGAPTFFVNGKMLWGTPEVLWFLDDEFERFQANPRQQSGPDAGRIATRSLEMLEERADAAALAAEARRKIEALSPDAAIERYELLRAKPIAELTEVEYTERLVLAGRLSSILKDQRKRKH